MLLLGFLLVIAAALTIWAALTLNEHVPGPALQRVDEARDPLPQRRARPSNDEVRGARARPVVRQRSSDDAFERFLRSDAGRDESEF